MFVYHDLKKHEYILNWFKKKKGAIPYSKVQYLKISIYFFYFIYSTFYVDIVNLVHLISISNVSTFEFEDQKMDSVIKVMFMVITGYRIGIDLIRRWRSMLDPEIFSTQKF